MGKPKIQKILEVSEQDYEAFKRDHAPQQSSSETGQSLLVRQLEVKEVPNLDATISLAMETRLGYNDQDPLWAHFLLTPPAARYLAESLEKAVQDYLNSALPQETEPHPQTPPKPEC